MYSIKISYRNNKWFYLNQQYIFISRVFMMKRKYCKILQFITTLTATERTPAIHDRSLETTSRFADRLKNPIAACLSCNICMFLVGRRSHILYKKKVLGIAINVINYRQCSFPNLKFDTQVIMLCVHTKVSIYCS